MGECLRMRSLFRKTIPLIRHHLGSLGQKQPQKPGFCSISLANFVLLRASSSLLKPGLAAGPRNRIRKALGAGGEGGPVLTALPLSLRLAKLLADALLFDGMLAYFDCILFCLSVCLLTFQTQLSPNSTANRSRTCAARLLPVFSHRTMM